LTEAQYRGESEAEGHDSTVPMIQQFNDSTVHIRTTSSYGPGSYDPCSRDRSLMPGAP
jgi:hypothetical protein